MTQGQRTSIERIAGMLEGIAAVAEKADFLDKKALANAIGDCVEHLDELLTDDLWDDDQADLKREEWRANVGADDGGVH